MNLLNNGKNRICILSAYVFLIVAIIIDNTELLIFYFSLDLNMPAIIIFFIPLILVLLVGGSAANFPNNFLNSENMSFLVHGCANEDINGKYL